MRSTKLFTVRLPIELMAALREAHVSVGVSRNQFIADLIAAAVEHNQRRIHGAEKEKEK